MFCKRCGNPLEAEARFCLQCGLPAGAAVRRPVMQRPFVVSLLAVLHFLSAPFMLLAGIVVLFAPRESPGDAGVMAGLALFMVGSAVLSLIAGAGLWKLQPWGRTIQIVLSAIGLLGFPLGTLISAAILWYFFTPQVKVLFSGKRPEELRADEIAALQQPAGSAAGVAVIAIAGIAAVAFIGIIAAIAIPNFMYAIERAKQKRTVADMRTLSEAIGKYANAKHLPPEAASMEELKATLGDDIALKRDGWNQPFRYQTDGRNFWLVSAGKDGVFEADDAAEYAEGEVESFEADIVVRNGVFLKWPKGQQER